MWGANFAISHWQAQSPLTQGWCYCAARDELTLQTHTRPLATNISTQMNVSACDYSLLQHLDRFCHFATGTQWIPNAPIAPLVTPAAGESILKLQIGRDALSHVHKSAAPIVPRRLLLMLLSRTV